SASNKGAAAEFLRGCNRGVEVGLSAAKAGPGIHTDVPTGPVIDRRGCRRRYPHIRCKSRCSDQSGGGDNADCQLVHKKPPKTGRIYTMRPAYGPWPTYNTPRNSIGGV